MDFRLRKDARVWFKSLDSSINSSAKLFELYYFCLCVGLVSGQKAEASTEETDELVNYYPGEFRSRGRILTAWLISKELESLGISVNERTQVHQAIRELVDPQSPSFLSDHGMLQVNRYASGGFEVLTEHIPEPPRALPTFLIRFRQILESIENASADVN